MRVSAAQNAGASARVGWGVHGELERCNLRLLGEARPHGARVERLPGNQFHGDLAIEADLRGQVDLAGLLRVPDDRLEAVKKRLPNAGIVTEQDLAGLLVVEEKKAQERAREKKEAAAQARKNARARKLGLDKPAPPPPAKGKPAVRPKGVAPAASAPVKKAVAAPKKKPVAARKPASRHAKKK